MERQEALNIVHQFIKSESLIHHLLSVEAAMRWYAEKFEQDAEIWGLAGLLHDYDWEVHPSAEDHPLLGLPYLRERGVPEEIIYAIASHADKPDYPRLSMIDKALYACDEVTGIVTATALIRPSKSLYDLEAKSVKKKWKDHSFAAGTDRTIMENGAADLGVPLWDHVQNVIHAMRKIAPALGLAGSLPPTE